MNYMALFILDDPSLLEDVLKAWKNWWGDNHRVNWIISPATQSYPNALSVQ